MLTVVLSMVLAGSPPPHAAVPAWQTLYEVRAPDGYIASVWLNGDGTWRAGGKDVILSGGPTGVAVTPVPGHTALAFGADESGTVLAAGNNLAIWEEHRGGFRLVQEKSGPRLKGRAALGDELIGIAHLDPKRPRRLFAYGLDQMLAENGPGSTWQALDDRALIHDANFGPTSGLPSGCHPMRWYRWGGRDGLLQCHEGPAFLYRSGAFNSIGRAPPGCVDHGLRAALDGERLVMACGSGTSTVWVRRADGEPWSRLPRTPPVLDLSARNGCVLVATRRAVLRWCDAGASGP